MAHLKINRTLLLALSFVMASLPALAENNLDVLIKQAEADITAGDVHGATINLDGIIAQTEKLPYADPHLAAALMYKGALALHYRNLDGAGKLLARALGYFAQLPKTHKSTENQALCEAYLASLKELQGNFEESEKAYQKGLELLQGIGDKDDQAPIYNGLGTLYFKMQKYGESESAHRKAMESFLAINGKDSDEYICATNNLATALEHQNKYDESARLSCEALALTETKYGANSGRLLPILENLATVYERKKQPEMAEQVASRALDLAEQLAGKDSPALWEFTSSLGLIYLENGKYKEAEAQLLRAVTLLSQAKGDNQNTLSMLYFKLANDYEATNQKEQAECYYKKAIASTTVPNVKKVYDEGLAKFLKKVSVDKAEIQFVKDFAQ